MGKLSLLFSLLQMNQVPRKSANKLRALQEKQLREILVYAQRHSSYYRRSFAAVGITEANVRNTPLSSFPTIDKAHFFEHFDEIVTVDVTQNELRRFDSVEMSSSKIFKNQYHVVHSSGSTGKPSYFLYDETAWNTMLLGIIRAALWNMNLPQLLHLLKSKPRVAYLAATDGRYGGAMAVGDGIQNIGGSTLALDIKMPLEEWVQRIRAFRPNVIIGYPSAIKILAELMENKDVTVHAQRVISCGEPLGGTLRRYLENIFGMPIVNIYGASESLALGVEVDPKEGILLFDDLNLIEFTDGKMYLTSLYNKAQPLIRYHLTDCLTLESPLPNSRFSLTRATGLLGRNEDILWFEDAQGKREFLHPLAIEGFSMDGLLDYQFCQTGRASFEMWVETTPGASKENIQSKMLFQMQKILHEKVLDNVSFRVRFVDNIRPDPRTGKKKLVVVQTGKENLVG